MVGFLKLILSSKYVSMFVYALDCTPGYKSEMKFSNWLNKF